MQYKSPITFSFIFMLLIVNGLILLLAPIFIYNYFIVFLILIIIDLSFIATIRTVVIKDHNIKVYNLFTTKEYSYSQLKYVEVNYRFNKYSQRSLIFQFINNKIILQIPDYNISKLEEIIKDLSEKNVIIKINSNQEIHQRLKKYVK